MSIYAVLNPTTACRALREGLRPQVPWPETGAWIGERLPSVIDDRGLIRALADVIEEYEGMAVDAADRALRPLPINL